MNRKIALAGAMTCGLSAPSAMAVTMDQLDIHGYFSFEYENHISGDAGGDNYGSFDLDLFDLVMNFQLSEKVRVATDITWEHGTATEDTRGNAAVEYAFAEYTVSEQLKFRAGKMFTHFGIYNEIHTAKPATLTVKEPLSTNKNNKLGSDYRFYPRWNTGVAILGGSEIGENYVDYIVQIANGEDDEVNPYEEDANTSKAISSRVRFDFENGLNAGLSYFRDNMNHYDGAGNVDGRTRINSYGAQLEYTFNESTGIELEYVAGSVQELTAAKVKRNAYTAMLHHTFTNSVTPYYRYEYLEPDKNTPNDTGSIHIVGVNIMIDDNVYLKMEFDQFNTDAANAKYSGNDFVEFKSSLSIGF